MALKPFTIYTQPNGSKDAENPGDWDATVPVEVVTLADAQQAIREAYTSRDEAARDAYLSEHYPKGESK